MRNAGSAHKAFRRYGGCRRTDGELSAVRPSNASAQDLETFRRDFGAWPLYAAAEGARLSNRLSATEQAGLPELADSAA